MHEIANPNRLLECSPDSGGSGVGPRTPGSVKNEPFVKAVVVLGPIEHHTHQRALVLGLEDLPGVGQCDLLGFAAAYRFRRSRRAVQPGQRRRDAVLTEGAVNAHGTIARIIRHSIIGRQRDRVILIPAHDGVDAAKAVFDGFDVSVRKVVQARAGRTARPPAGGSLHRSKPSKGRSPYI